MENLAKYHGSPLNATMLADALQELGVENDVEKWKALRALPVATHTIRKFVSSAPTLAAGTPIVYGADSKTDNRSAYGNALQGLAEVNNVNGVITISGISCDLEGSVKMGGFRKHSPVAYIEAGIQEHHAASMAGGMSSVGMVPFFSTFGAFALSEVYNQTRINDFNHTNVKVVATHVGLDVGEDGPTHQCIDYLGLTRNFFRFSVFMPADPNQTDRIIRYAATREGNVFVGMGRSITPVIVKEDGTPFFDAEYVFEAGKADWLRRKNDAQATIITYGALTPAVMEAWALLAGEGKSVAVLNMASLVPLDKGAVLEAASIGPIVTVEDHHIDTGLGAMVALVLAESGQAVPFTRCGVQFYGGSGQPAELYAKQGLDAVSIAATVKGLL